MKDNILFKKLKIYYTSLQIILRSKNQRKNIEEQIE